MGQLHQRIPPPLPRVQGRGVGLASTLSEATTVTVTIPRCGTTSRSALFEARRHGAARPDNETTVVREQKKNNGLCRRANLRPGVGVHSP